MRFHGNLAAAWLALDADLSGSISLKARERARRRFIAFSGPLPLPGGGGTWGQAFDMIPVKNQAPVGVQRADLNFTGLRGASTGLVGSLFPPGL